MSSSDDSGRSSCHRIRPTPRALQDVEDIHAWIARDSPGAADRWVGELFEAVETLGRFPRRCPHAPEEQWIGRGLRQLVIGDYRILFVIDDTYRVVDVLHIRHGSRGSLQRGDLPG